MSRTLLFAAVSLCFAAVPAPAFPSSTTWYVDDDACPGPGSGTLGDPFCSIQDAIDAALDGDVVLVLPGTYQEALDYSGKAVHVRSRDGAAVTTLRGDGFTAIVRFANGEGLDSIFDGFTVTGAGEGGAIVSLRFTAPTITDNVISGNDSFNSAMPAVSSYGDAWIHHNVISDNSATYGFGGLYCAGQSLVEYNRIERNGSGFHVGGLGCSGDSIVRYNLIAGNGCGDAIAAGVKCSENATLAYNVIAENTHYEAYAGGVVCSGAVRVLSNLVIGNQGGIALMGATGALIADNVVAANFDSGGIYCSASTATLVNNTVHGNDSLSDAGGLTVEDDSTVEVVNSIFWGNTGFMGPEISVRSSSSTTSTLTISYCDVEGGQASVAVGTGGVLNWGAGMIDADPCLADPAGLDGTPATWRDNDYHLYADSPCIDAGDNSAVTSTEDFEADPRRHDVPSVPDSGSGTAPLVDLGADEFHRHLYVQGPAYAGSLVVVKLADLPGSAPVLLWLALARMEDPLGTPLGDWYLLPPATGLTLPPIPGNGILTLAGSLPGSPPGPYTFYMQALSGVPLGLSNLVEVDVE